MTLRPSGSRETGSSHSRTTPQPTGICRGLADAIEICLGPLASRRRLLVPPSAEDSNHLQVSATERWFNVTTVPRGAPSSATSRPADRERRTRSSQLLDLSNFALRTPRSCVLAVPWCLTVYPTPDVRPPCPRRNRARCFLGEQTIRPDTVTSIRPSRSVAVGDDVGSSVVHLPSRDGVFSRPASLPPPSDLSPRIRRR